MRTKESKKSKKKTSINACKKGKAVERELVHLLKEHGVEDAQRSAQHEGNGEASDVKAKSLWMFHIECKGEKNPTLTPSTLKRWISQLERDCPEGRIPILFHKANNSPWIAMCYPCFTTSLSPFKLCYSVHPVVDASFNPSTLLNKARTEQNLRERASRDETGNYFPSDLIKFCSLIKDYEGQKLLYFMYGTTAAKLMVKIRDDFTVKTSHTEHNSSEPDPQSSALVL